MTDRGGRRQVAWGQLATDPARTANAETAIALVVALACGDRVQVIPDPQRMRIVAVCQPVVQARVRFGRRGFDIGTAAGIGDLERAELQGTVRAPGDAALAAMRDLAFDPPAFERCIAMRRQGNMQVARIVMRSGYRIAEPEHGQQSRIGQQRVQRLMPEFDAQGGRGGMRGGVVQGVHRGADDSARRAQRRFTEAAAAAKRWRTRRTGRRSPADCTVPAGAPATGHRAAGTG